jgi:DNA-binding XRE family transcriptional regulator
MGVSLETMMNRLSPEERAKVEARAAELIAEEMTLRDLRKARELTQVKLAKLLKIKQESVSNIEKRSDLLLSTLRGYVEAMGGELTLVASFPDRPPVQLKGIYEKN